MVQHTRGGKGAEWWCWGQVGFLHFLCCWAVLGVAASVQAEQFPQEAPEGQSRSAKLTNSTARSGWIPQGSEFSGVRARSPERVAWIPKGSEFSSAQVRRAHEVREPRKPRKPRQIHSPQHAPKPAVLIQKVQKVRSEASPVKNIAAARERKQRDTQHTTSEKLVCSVPQEERLSFLRYPLQFTRISSRFSNTRLHPILKRTRPHRGVDFAAPRGTPVRAVADGTVTHAGWLGGLGRAVRINHSGPYRSDYGHLDRLAKAVKLGRTVQQGQVIGYVGATGLATGPHLHFGLAKHGRYINPLTEQLPRLAARVTDNKSQPLGFRGNDTQQTSCRTNETPQVASLGLQTRH